LAIVIQLICLGIEKTTEILKLRRKVESFEVDMSYENVLPWIAA
jgi:hypothetical protein